MKTTLGLVLALAMFTVSAVWGQAGGENPHGKIAIPCATCHSSDGWRPARIDTSFNHSRFGFALTDAHGAVSCKSCHTLEFSRVDRTCAGCHQDVHRSEFGTNCGQCHTTKSFIDRSAQVRAHDQSRFPLDGAHRTVDCQACHARSGGGQLAFRAAPTECAQCHRADFANTTNPPHAAAGFKSACTACHTTATWNGAGFDHSTTSFALTGGHKAVACNACHADNVYDGRSMACVSCHSPDFDRTTEPKHSAAGFPTECTVCHTTATWDGAPYDHQKTAFPLTGAHQAVGCQPCHADAVYGGKPTTCIACHQSSYSQTANPPHQAAGFASDCTTCHTTITWQGAAFDHKATSFPLTGAHPAATCQQCHADGVYDGKPTTCVSCHQSDYTGTTKPAHQTAGFPTDCTACHSTATWTGATFDHGVTQFPLTGAHLATPCQQCHADGVYDGKPTTCVACHQTSYNQTTNPPHQAAGFATSCTDCHTTATWTGGTFNHSSTQFPLTGAHLATPCQQCHADRVYDGKPTTCVSCHQANYTQTSNPPHQAAGFATSCADCHSTATWTGATFNHSTTQFPLTGAHVATPCQQCHGDGVYNGKPTTCISCHQTDYSGTTNPPHQSAGFPTDCTSCHTTTTWTGATFDHDSKWFPIYSGKHFGKWNTCAACHSNPASFAVFTCLTCHEHNKTKMDDTHKSTSGYQYQSQACYSCHPNGRKP